VGDGQRGWSARLFTFVPDGSDWFIGEVKGLTDTVKANQWDWAGRLRGQLLANGLDPRGRVPNMNIARF